MSAPSLTAKYRPQRFGDVAGQEAIKRILSKASAEDRIAPAYLFSGTRGVGKTTLARVLAKALNCVTAPTGEPCNECAQCRQITAGVSPDVIEIDAATHGGVDEARRLKEDIGYAPLQSRYKVFIIDEAHMLSKAAFNALLKTLEEPPGRVTFILATTEPHKILPTIISRCQHYIFKRLTQPELEAHLVSLLVREAVDYEPSALSILARRGAGSVRDSMSLLAQVLASGGPSLTEEDVRDILGLAGQDVFFSLMQAFEAQDCLAVSEVLRTVLDRGLDIGFFLRELSACWRNLFILKQAGEKALGSLEMSEEEGRRWLEWADRFEARNIHASWQMTLEGQRRVMSSLEPALALELLLLNLAYLPQLISLESLGAPPAPNRCGPGAPRQAPMGAPGGRPGGGYGPSSRPSGGPGAGGYAPASGDSGPSQRPAASAQGHQAPSGQPGGYDASQRPGPAASGPGSHVSAGYGAPSLSSGGSSGEPGQPTSSAPSRGGHAAPSGGNSAPSRPGAPASAAQGYGADPGPTGDGYAPAPQSASAVPPAPSAGAAQRTSGSALADAAPASAHRPSGPRDWKGFHHHLREWSKNQGVTIAGLPILKGEIADASDGAVVTLKCHGEAHHRQLSENVQLMGLLRERAVEYFGPGSRLDLDAGSLAQVKPQEDLRAEVAKEPLFQEAVEKMGGHLLYVKPRS